MENIKGQCENQRVTLLWVQSLLPGNKDVFWWRQENKPPHTSNWTPGSSSSTQGPQISNTCAVLYPHFTLLCLQPFFFSFSCFSRETTVSQSGVLLLQRSPGSVLVVSVGPLTIQSDTKTLRSTWLSGWPLGTRHRRALTLQTLSHSRSKTWDLTNQITCFVLTMKYRITWR